MSVFRADTAATGQTAPRAAGLFGTDARRTAWVFIGSVFWIALLTVARPSIFLDLGIHTSFLHVAVWAFVPLLIGALFRTPASLITGYLLGSLSIQHRAGILLSFALGISMLAFVLWRNRRSLRSFFSFAFARRGFGYLLAASGYITAVWLIRLGDSTDAWSLLALGASLFTVPCAVYSLSYLSWTEDERAKAIRYGTAVLCALGFVVAVMPLLAGAFEQYANALYVFDKAAQALQITLPFSIGHYIETDDNGASLRSAHFMAAIMLAVVVGMLILAFLRRDWRYALLSLAAFLVFSMGENAHILAGVGAAAVSIIAIAVLHKRVHPGLLSASVIILAIATGIVAVQWNYGSGGYFHDAPKGKAYQLALQYALDHPGRMILGEGSAAFSSHACRKRLPADLTDDRDFPLLPDFTPPAYGAIMARVHVPNTSSTINRAPSGALGLVMEWGILGTILILFILATLIKNAIEVLRHSADTERRAGSLTAIFMVLTILTTLVFRPYLEYPDVTSVVAVLFLLAVVRNVERWQVAG